MEYTYLDVKHAIRIILPCLAHNSLKLNSTFELNGTKAYEETSKDEKSVVYSHSNEIPKKVCCIC